MIDKKSALEVAANAAILLSAVLFCGILINAAVTERNAREEARPYHRGDRMESIRGLNLDRSATSLLLVLRSSCRFCNESLPFYHRLLDSARNAGVASVALMFDTQNVAGLYVQKNELQVREVVAIQGNQLRRVSGTPTLILIDRTGTVINSWIGKLSEDGESEVFDAIRHVK
ncbi:MAG TPA: hypothetical protein VL309_05205 [Vicinamibacterales bacterium]|jgi:hypothetical protein|nr:hypothetical protein [Vicinamibacterales bacterium]